MLLVASYVFYMSWSPPFGLIYAPVIFGDSAYFYFLSVAMVKWPKYKKHLLIFGITTELMLLAYFKYANFFAQSIEAMLTAMNLPAYHFETHTFLPLAISFTNFILISYLVDIYRGTEKPDTFVRFSTYVAFFPHLIAGPIVRASELLHQFDSNPAFKWENVVKGIHKFCTGLFIKLFVADVIAVYVNMIYGNADLQGFNSSWVATYGFAIQIFCDFLGYTLMAQGSALLMGYTLPENFNAPYFAKNITDFWRRWHISLSRWLRDYLYIPLGGSRCSRFRTYLNLFITMGLGGLWHGASWNFVIWGLYQGLLLSLHKFCMYFKINRLIPGPVAVLLTFHLVCIGWVFFRAQTLEQALHMIGTMLNPMEMATVAHEIVNAVESGTESLDLTSALFIILMFFLMHWLIRTYRDKISSPLLKDCAIAVGYFALIYFGLTMSPQTQQFIYFQF